MDNIHVISMNAIYLKGERNRGINNVIRVGAGGKNRNPFKGYVLEN